MNLYTPYTITTVGNAKFSLYPLSVFWLGLTIKLTEERLTEEKYTDYMHFIGHRSPHKEMKTQRSGKAKCFYTRLNEERQLWKSN